ncbi:uncharacterized protein TrAFT101_011319 [Trichoderma asperellum]|uniref:uncharacterized protein n=1 Tax=Trichoderma asperellum TaxID=101201 RepID=UPI00332E801A|nr:hypothetical protein TrAFT101_011319 [Trichoderma asperellum]
MSLQKAPILYTDDSPRVGGREYLGCFSIDKVRQRLDQPLLEPLGTTERENETAVEEEIAAVENHFLPNRACSALHVNCNPSPTELGDIEIPLQQLHQSYEAGCWFCTIIYGGITAAPLWDIESKGKRPKHTYLDERERKCSQPGLLP